MENIFVAIVVIFILLFGGLTMSDALITAQQTVSDAQQERANRANESARSAVAPVEMRILNSGSLIEVTLRNNGTLKIADFDRWDVFAEYYDGSPTPAYHVARLPYDTSAMHAVNSWAVGGIYLDWQQAVREDYEPGILNPGEDITLTLNASPAVGVGQSAQVTVVTEFGAPASIIGKRNAPPSLTLNTGIRVALHGSETFTVSALLAQDADNDPSQLVYTVTAAPTQGTLTPTTHFTQQQINNGEVIYTHTGSDPDSIELTLSDGIDSTVPFPVSITINTAPVLATNAGLTLPPSASAAITSSLLQTTDTDDSANKLTYTVTQFPANGMLSLGSTFTQDDIDHNRLSYTHTGTDADLFKFVVSDGYDVIGAYSFVITLAAQ